MENVQIVKRTQTKLLYVNRSLIFFLVERAQVLYILSANEYRRYKVLISKFEMKIIFLRNIRDVVGR